MKRCPRCGAEYADTTTLCPADGTGLETTGSDPLVGETLAGKYRVEERLSVGGMGTVYRATHILMDKKVAIKVLRPSLAADEKIVARFSREARAASKISHPHALSVTDFGEDEGGVVFLVMEFLNGRTLKEVIRQDGPLPLSRVVEIMRQVCSALDAAHAEGVVHRDLKSDNIMLLNTTGDYAKVLDFGIAKIQEPMGVEDAGLTSPDLIIGTPQYMSPEQCSQSEKIDSRSDIYSLGVILYEMLVGHVPFMGESPTVVMLKHLQEVPRSVFEERPDLPSGVGTVLERALAKRREDRYQTAGALVEDLVIAEGTGLVQPELGDRTANRIVVPKKEPTGEVPAEDDEQTLVRSRTPAYVPPPEPPPIRPQPAAPVHGFNPWRILIPSLAGLLVVFAVIYAFTRTSQPTANPSQVPTLSPDPNSQSVQPASPPTGQNERGIPLGGAVSPASSANTNVNAAVSPTPSSDQNTNANSANDNKAVNANSNRAPELPSPRNTPEPSPQPTPTLPPAATPKSTSTPPPPPVNR